MPHLERLTRLADLLEQPLPDRYKFDIAAWHEQNPYGTVCCALGLAGADVSFQQQGMSIVNGLPVYKDMVGSDTASVFFEISAATVQHLFMPDSYDDTNPDQYTVAARIRTLIAQHAQLEVAVVPTLALT